MGSGIVAYISQLLVAEVQAFFQDGAMSLHTRSLKYGKVSTSISTLLQAYKAPWEARTATHAVHQDRMIILSRPDERS